MNSSSYALGAVRRETAIIKHLATKLHADRLDYRPSPGQRSTLELLRYLPMTAIAPTLFLTTGKWDHAKALGARVAELQVSGFAAAMDRQQAEVEAALAPLTEHDLENTQISYPWGGSAALGVALLDLPVSFMIAYRMQLFLYAKASGASELTTSNCWGGRDAPPAQAAAAR
jgi:hypothetical protein